MARKLLWCVVLMNAVAAVLCVGVAVLSLAGSIGGGGEYDEYGFLNPYLAAGSTAVAVASAVLSGPAVLALRWQRAPPASRRSGGAVALLVLAALVNVVLGLGWMVLAVVSRGMALELVDALVVVLGPNVFALVAAWSWRPWARQPGKPLRWTPP
jgi:hypothetical protein